ncbi:MAG: TrkH family potassium uptake protein [Rhodospirillales bacterium]|nr:TrkH family potassium uptake protein [Rhodospirillales bacterium]
MLRIRPVLHLTGILMLPVGGAMLIPMAADLLAGRPSALAFAGTGAATAFVGVALALACRSGTLVGDSGRNHDPRQVLALITLWWLLAIVLAALPLYFADHRINYTDAFFEAASGLTTTGASVFTDLDHRPPGVLLWRAMLQWFGGLGIVVIALVMLPFREIGGMEVIRIDQDSLSGGRRLSDARLALVLVRIYLILTAIWVVLLRVAGMEWFDALCHAMTTIATGGYSTRDGSVGACQSGAVETVVIIGMLAASLPFIGYRQIAEGNWRRFAGNPEVGTFFAVVVAAVGAVMLWLWLGTGAGPLDALRRSAFNVISVMTGTGYATEDFSGWGGGTTALLFLLMFVGGCSGSTTGGLRIFRIQVMLALVTAQLRKVPQPRLVSTPRLAGKRISEDTLRPVLSIAALFLITVTVLAGFLSILGLDRLTSLSAAASAVAIVGPGLGPVVGPAGSYAPLPDAAKWALSVGMLLGRLEFLTALVMFAPGFWRR